MMTTTLRRLERPTVKTRRQARADEAAQKRAEEMNWVGERVVCDAHGSKWKDRHAQTPECVNPRKGDSFEGFE